MNQFKIKGEHLAKLLVAGKCRIIVESIATGNMCTFEIKKNEDWQTKQEKSFYVRSAGKILGHIRGDKYVFYPPGQPLTKEQEVFKWLWANSLKPDHLDRTVKLYHNGKCAHCQRPLTDPESVLRGLGPDCLKKLT